MILPPSIKKGFSRSQLIFLFVILHSVSEGKPDGEWGICIVLARPGMVELI